MIRIAAIALRLMFCLGVGSLPAAGLTAEASGSPAAPEQLLRQNSGVQLIGHPGQQVSRLSKNSVPVQAQTAVNATVYVGSGGGTQVLMYDRFSGAFLGQLDPEGLSGVDSPRGMVFGPDGNIYVSSRLSDNILRFNRETGEFMDVFVPAGSGGLDGPTGLAFGPDGKLYVSSSHITDSRQVLRYDALTGAFIDVFIAYSDGPRSLVFGPDGNLYIGQVGNNTVGRYNSQTGAFIDDFAHVSGDLIAIPAVIAFGPDDNLYISGFHSNEVVRVNGTTGDLIDEFIVGANTALDGALGIAFAPDGYLYVNSRSNDSVLRYNAQSGAFVDTFVASGADGLTQPWGILLGPPVGGSATGMSTTKYRCQNQARHQSVVLATTTLKYFACNGAGVRLFSGDPIALTLTGAVDTSTNEAVGGSVTGMTPSLVSCIDNTTGQTVTAAISTTSWSCADMGLIAGATDTIVQVIKTTVD